MHNDVEVGALKACPISAVGNRFDSRVLPLFHYLSTGERISTNYLQPSLGQACLRKVVRLTDRPDMTLGVYHGRKVRNQTNKHFLLKRKFQAGSDCIRGEDSSHCLVDEDLLHQILEELWNHLIEPQIGLFAKPI